MTGSPSRSASRTTPTRPPSPSGSSAPGVGTRSLVAFTLGTGVGGGIVLDGHLYRGWAELGHIVVDADGAPCQGSCHGRGHLEAVASGLAADRAARELYGPEADAHLLVRRAHAGERRGGRGASSASATSSGSESARSRTSSIPRSSSSAAASGRQRARSCCARRARRRLGRRSLLRTSGCGSCPRRSVRTPVSWAPRSSGSRRSTGSADGVPLAVCATPIGNLDDVTLRVLEELREADLVLCEDTRHTRILLERHGLRPRSLLSCHQHNEAQRVAEIVPRLVAGERVALVSDAGLPGINDPGARLVAAALAAGDRGDRAARPVGGRDRTRRERARGRAVPLPRVPATAGRGTGCSLGRDRGLAASVGRVRVSASAAFVAGEPRCGAAGASGRRLPGADQALRGDRPRAPRRSSLRGSRSPRRERSRS